MRRVHCLEYSSAGRQFWFLERPQDAWSPQNRDSLDQCRVRVASAGAARARRRPAEVLGTAGWEITDGRTVVLIDPYLSRLRRVTPNDTVDPADNRPLFDNAAIAQSDTAAIDAHIQRADFKKVLITHTHYDHALDAPYIASKTGATIIGTESTYHFARAQGVPADKLIVVRGGEDYVFEGLSVRVIPSLHGVLRRAPNRRPGSQRVVAASGVPARCQTSVSHG